MRPYGFRDAHSGILSGYMEQGTRMISLRNWQQLNSWLLGAFVALLIVLPWAYALLPLAAAILALGGLGLSTSVVTWRQRFDRTDGLWCLALLTYAAIWLWDVRRTGHWPVGEGEQGLLLPLWPVLAAALLVWLRCYRPSPRHWWIGCCLGALSAGGIALYERLVLGAARADNGMNAIPFGNLALLLGGLSLLAVLWWGQAPGLSRRWRSVGIALAAFSALSGLLASLLSGTRGGWIAAPLLLWFCYRTGREVLGTAALRHWRGAMLGVVLLLVCLMALPQTGVTERLTLAVDNVQQYWQDDHRGSSVGLRLEMWRSGWWLFSERPWTGWGEGRLEVARDAWVASGALHPGVSAYDQLHSDIIDTAARRGLLGLAGLGLLYGVPILLFSRRLRHPNSGVQVLAVAGLVITLAFIDFGLTQSMLRDVRGLSGYLGLCMGCWAVLRREEALGNRLPSVAIVAEPPRGQAALST